MTRRSVLRAGVGLAGMAAAGGTLFEQGARLAFASGGGGGSSDNVVIQWNNTALECVRRTIPGPTITSRALAVMHTAMYDAWSTYDPVAQPTVRNGIPKHGGGNGLGGKIHSINYAAYRALLDLFPTQTSFIVGQMQAVGEDPNDSSTDTNSPSGIGNVAARAVISFRHSDGSNQLNGYADTTGYAPVNTPDTLNDPRRWQPLRVNGKVQKFTTPQWGTVKPFALTSGSQFRPTPGPITDVTSAAFKSQVDTVVNYSANLTDTTKAIAYYWANGPNTEFPPGHWDLLSQFASAQFVSHRNKNDPNNDTLLFFALANAIFDAGIACWESKRFYDYVRPITAVRFLDAKQQITAWGGIGKGPTAMQGSQWLPYQEASVVTPPFAEYPSGHSTFSAAGAYVLAQFCGSDTFGDSFTVTKGSSVIEPGIAPSVDVTLSWATFSDAAVQAGLSRQYGGIHFVQGDVDGRALGRNCGVQAWSKAQAYISGTAY